MLHDHHEHPPQECEVCGIYKVYHNGLCWKCIQTAIAAHKTQEIKQLHEENKDDRN